MEKVDLAFDDEADAIRWRDAIIEQVCMITLQERGHLQTKLFMHLAYIYCWSHASWA